MPLFRKKQTARITGTTSITTFGPEIEIKFLPEGAGLRNPTPDTEASPEPNPAIAALCKDITDHPENYRRLDEKHNGCLKSVIQHHRNPDLSITGWFGALPSYCHCYADPKVMPTDADKEALRKAFDSFIAYERKTATAAMEKRITEALMPDSRAKAVQDVRDAINATGHYGPLADRHVHQLVSLATRMLSVLDGTHKIVPVIDSDANPWYDAAGKPHQTRAAMREANKKARAK